MTTYRALADGWIAGRRVKAGEILDLTLAQAKYEPVEPAADPAPAEPAPKALRRGRG